MRNPFSLFDSRRHRASVDTTTTRSQTKIGNLVVGGIIAAGFVYLFVGRHLWRDISIALHEQHTQGIVTGFSRGTLYYRCTVNGRAYTGYGRGDYRRPSPDGSEVQVRYSSVHPSFSTIDQLFLFQTQTLCGAAMFGVIFLIVYLNRKPLLKSWNSKA